MKTKTKTTKPVAVPLDPTTMKLIIGLLRQRAVKYEASAKQNAREGGVMLAHANSEWVRGTECELLTEKLYMMLDAQKGG